MKKKLIIVAQVLMWLLFCMLPIFFLPQLPDGVPHPVFRNPTMFLFDFLIKNIKFIVLFYVHYLYLIPNYFNAKKYRLYLIYLTILFVIVAAIPFLNELFFHINIDMQHHARHSHHDMHHHEYEPHRRSDFDQGMHFFMTIIVTIIPFLLNTYKNWVLAQKENIVMELALLKSQINHHFLFNSLNNIYSLSVQQNEKTPAAIHSLSFIMRYILDETNKESTSLEKELKYIHHYISLQRLRIGDKTTMTYEVVGEVSNQKISPMILIPFIENCFKHGLSGVKEGEIKVQIEILENGISLFTQNNKYPKTSASGVVSGIGIKNVLKRLDYDYEGKYQLEIDDRENQYTINLKIDLI